MGMDGYVFGDWYVYVYIIVIFYENVIYGVIKIYIGFLIWWFFGNFLGEEVG